MSVCLGWFDHDQAATSLYPRRGQRVSHAFKTPPVFFSLFPFPARLLADMDMNSNKYYSGMWDSVYAVQNGLGEGGGDRGHPLTSDSSI